MNTIIYAVDWTLNILVLASVMFENIRNCWKNNAVVWKFWPTKKIYFLSDERKFKKFLKKQSVVCQY